MHSSADCCLSKRAYPQRSERDTKELLKDISKTCEDCQVYSLKYYDVSIIILRRSSILTDVIYLDGKPAFLITDTRTNFAAARFHSTENSRAL